MGAESQHFDEQARLAELRGLDLERSSGDARLDQLTRLASELFEVPVALVTLIEADRQRFYARCGFDDLDGTPRSDAFCHRTIQHDELMVVPDAMLDPRFSANPLVTGEPYIRFYAGAVLRGPGGYALGSLCLIDYVPREFDRRDQRRLLQVARVAESILIGGDDAGDGHAGERPVQGDAATGLPGRAEMLERLRTILRDPVSPSTSIVVAHVDGMPEMEATLGENAAATFMRVLADRFRATVPRQASLGRWDSAELIVLAPAAAGADPDALAEDLAAAADTPVTLSGQAIRRSLSIGIARSADDAGEARLLIDRAGSAAARSPADTARSPRRARSTSPRGCRTR